MRYSETVQPLAKPLGHGHNCTVPRGTACPTGPIPKVPVGAVLYRRVPLGWYAVRLQTHLLSSSRLSRTL